MSVVRALLFALSLLAVWGAVRGWSARHGAVASGASQQQEFYRA